MFDWSNVSDRKEVNRHTKKQLHKIKTLQSFNPVVLWTLL